MSNVDKEKSKCCGAEMEYPKYPSNREICGKCGKDFTPEICKEEGKYPPLPNDEYILKVVGASGQDKGEWEERFEKEFTIDGQFWFSDWDDLEKHSELINKIKIFIKAEKKKSYREGVRDANDFADLPKTAINNFNAGVRSTASQIIEVIEKLKGDKALTEHPYFKGFTPIGAWKSALDSAKQLIISKFKLE